MRSVLLMVVVSAVWMGCSKERVSDTVPNNEATPPHRVSTIKVENYVNRLFIDLLGRTPTEEELSQETDTLFAQFLSEQSRINLVRKLQWDASYREGDSSYTIVYFQRLYDLIKAKMIEGASDGEFGLPIGLAKNEIERGRIEGDSARVYAGKLRLARNQNVIASRIQQREGAITINEVFSRMLDNAVYDKINMNTFNFVNASFDDLFGRYPTENEFDASFDIIEKNEVRSLLGGFASNKREYCILLTESDEFHEGLIYWAYQSLLGRNPSTVEVATWLPNLRTDKNFQGLQENIVITDEYANF